MNEPLLTMFRILSAVVISGTAGYITWRLVRGDLAPTVVWVYAASVLWFVAAFRWFIVWLLTEGGAALYAIMEIWLQPMTQSMQALLAMVIFVLTYTHIRERRLHYDRFHDDEIRAIAEILSERRGEDA